MRLDNRRGRASSVVARVSRTMVSTAELRAHLSGDFGAEGVVDFVELVVIVPHLSVHLGAHGIVAERASFDAEVSTVESP